MSTNLPLIACIISVAILGVSQGVLVSTMRRRIRANQALIEMLMALREYDAAKASGDDARFAVEHQRISSLSIKLASVKETSVAGTWVLRAACGFRWAPQGGTEGAPCGTPIIDTPSPRGGRENV